MPDYEKKSNVLRAARHQKGDDLGTTRSIFICLFLKIILQKIKLHLKIEEFFQPNISHYLNTMKNIFQKANGLIKSALN